MADSSDDLTAQFFQAAANGDIKDMANFLQKGADVNWSCVSSFGNTPLMMACVNGLVDAVQFLLENGANPNAVANGGYTAAHRACFWGREDLTLALLDYGADLGLKNDSGHTALDECCGCGTTQLGKKLTKDDAQEMKARLTAYLNSSDSELRTLLGKSSARDVKALYQQRLIDGAAASDKKSNKVNKVRDDGRSEDERYDMADIMLSEGAPWTTVADPPLCLTYALRSAKVAWRMYDEDGDVVWMPYCAGRRRPGDEEESDF